MREDDLPSPRIGERGFKLRRLAAKTISGIQAAARNYPDGKHPDAAQLLAFFQACSAAAATLSRN